MVQFRQGMLGVAVVVIAIAGALLGSWAMSMDVEERTVTRYNPVVDITPLFDSELAPAYTDYNPATNYTGYHSVATTINGVQYFGGVEYEAADRANNFNLNLPPIEAHSGTVTLPNIDTTSVRQVWLYWQSDSDGAEYSSSDSIKAQKLTDVIAQLTSQTTGTVTIMSGQGPDITGETTTSLDLDWIIFGNINVYQGDHNYRFATKERIATWPGYYPPYQQTLALSCVADLDRNIATIYYDNECKERLADLTLDQVIVFCRGGSSALPGGAHHLMLASSVDYDFKAFPDKTYMNPSRGVEVED